ncbi:hypothetical protein HYU11_01330 [Candidatus Woesearchaeota archaeon]|nr:hypothetical protein [Candidatus Woesearchaeota archaeon]
MVLPQEIEIWYVIPALRRELALELVRGHSMPQKRIASVLGLTEAAVSQYVCLKRGAKVHFPRSLRREIALSAKRIANGSDAMRELMGLSGNQLVRSLVCTLHRKGNPSLRNCRICYGGYERA